MCGIAGIFAYGQAAPPVDEEELLRVREAMIREIYNYREPRKDLVTRDCVFRSQSHTEVLSVVASFPGSGRGFRRVSAPFIKRFTLPKYAGLVEY